MPGLNLAAYADETSFNSGRYRGIALVSLKNEDSPSYSTELRGILTAASVSELKWYELDSAKMRFAAQKALSLVLDGASRKALRADILIWDTHDSRHLVRGRDDIANLERMYYHLLKNVMSKRWPDNSEWNVFPDEQTALNWDDVEDFLYKASTTTEFVGPFMQPRRSFKLRLKTEFRIKEIFPSKSHEEPLIQMADLLAGMGTYSYEHFDTFFHWKKQNDPQTQMFECTVGGKFSHSDRERCRVLDEFQFACKSRKRGVSLKSSKGLLTRDPQNGINFWLYVPQHDEDVAPTKGASPVKLRK
jgi:hypothetical protein